MPDPATGEVALVGIGKAVETVGYTLAAILGLLYILRWLSNIHLQALNGRITTLEGVVLKRDEQIETAQALILTQATQHAHEMKDIAIRLANEIRDNRAFGREQHAVLVRLLDKLDQRPCMAADYQPHPSPKHGTSAELPQPPTDRTTGRA
jgi:hypothetical protein